MNRLPIKFLLMGLVWFVAWLIPFLFGIRNPGTIGTLLIAFAAIDFVGGLAFFLVRKYYRYKGKHVLNWIHEGERSENIIIDMEPPSMIDKWTVLRLFLLWSEHQGTDLLASLSNKLGGSGKASPDQIKSKLTEADDLMKNEDAKNPPASESDQARNAKTAIENSPSLKAFFDEIYPFKDKSGNDIFAHYIRARESELIEGDPTDQDLIIFCRRNSLDNEFLFMEYGDWLIGPWIVDTNVATAGGPTIETVKLKPELVEKKIWKIRYGEEMVSKSIRMLITTDSNAIRMDGRAGYTQQLEESTVKPTPRVVTLVHDFVGAAVVAPLVEENMQLRERVNELTNLVRQRLQTLLYVRLHVMESSWKFGWKHVALAVAGLTFVLLLVVLR